MIHDFTSKSRIGRSGFPKLKGHLKIELKDSKGRAVKTIEGDNMITDALKDIFASNYCGALDYRKMLPLYSKMLGGILCFGTNTLDVTSEGAAKDYFIPDNSTHPVIAHAGQTESSYGQADDTKRGSPLDTSMIVQDGAVTLAWEWGSAAGIGTIVSLGLTHSDVGDAGTGSNSQAFANMKPVINANFGLAYSNPTKTNLVMFVGSDGYGYRFTCNGQTVTFTKIPMAYEETGLVAPSPFTDSSQNSTHTVSTTTSFVQNRQPLWFYDEVNNKVWLFYSGDAGTSISAEQIDLSTWTATNKDFSADESVGPFYNDGKDAGVPFSGGQTPYYDGCVYLAASVYLATTKFLKVKLSNTADQDLLNNAVLPYGGVFRPNASHKILAGKRFVINNDVVYPTSYGTPDAWNYVQYGRGVSNYPFLNDGVGLALLGGQSGLQYYVAVSKFYLASKYNLPTPVSKQNGQSMVITYTLTEVS